MKKIRILSCLLVTILLPSFTLAGMSPSFVGGISTANGTMVATGEWGKYGGSLGWKAWVEDDVSHIIYRLSFNMPEDRAEISHVIFGVSPSFTMDNLLSWKVLRGSAEEMERGLWSVTPGTIDGIKFDEVTGTSLVLHLTSDRNFIWTDFFAKDGKAGGVWNEAWNSGFDDACGAKIIGFDTTCPPIIPAPGAFLLGGIGLSLIGLFRRRLN